MKKQILLLLTLIATIFIFTQCSNSIEKELEAKIKLVNSTAPVKVNEELRLDSCEVNTSEKRIMHYFTITINDSSKAEKYAEDIKSAKSSMIEDVKAEPTFASFRKNDVIFDYSYRNYMGREMLRVIITSEDYK